MEAIKNALHVQTWLSNMIRNFNSFANKKCGEINTFIITNAKATKKNNNKEIKCF